jgi:hypothetical protein
MHTLQITDASSMSVTQQLEITRSGDFRYDRVGSRWDRKTLAEQSRRHHEVKPDVGQGQRIVKLMGTGYRKPHVKVAQSDTEVRR